MTDFRKILIHYIGTVLSCEGTDFLGRDRVREDDDAETDLGGLTAEEFNALIDAAEEAERKFVTGADK